MDHWKPFALLPAALLSPHWAHADVYLTVEQAQQAMFPGIPLKPAPLRLSDEQRRAIERHCGVRVRVPDLQVWRALDGAVFLVDQVLGKHEFITYAVGIGPDGAVRGVEILDYRESYGYEIRNSDWRAQFRGRTVAAPLELDRDIRNIGGATLSSKHVTEGVRRLLATHELALR